MFQGDFIALEKFDPGPDFDFAASGKTVSSVSVRRLLDSFELLGFMEPI